MTVAAEYVIDSPTRVSEYVTASCELRPAASSSRTRKIRNRP